MLMHTARRFLVFSIAVLLLVSHGWAAPRPASDSAAIDLAQRYPTTLTGECLDPAQAYPWEFSEQDIFRLSAFNLKIGDALTVRIGPCNVGFGHCTEGAVWAVVIPDKTGLLSSERSKRAEEIDHLWLRFHPAQIATLFPPSTVTGTGDTGLQTRMERIARLKMANSYQAGGAAMIPAPERLTVDADTTAGPRRFFDVDGDAGTARYIKAFEARAVPKEQPLTVDARKDNFDKLWSEYDRKYAMFTLRPEVDWNELGDKYRARAAESETAYEFALVCAEMLKHLRDLHIWVRVGGQPVPVFKRSGQLNANRAARAPILGALHRAGTCVYWAKTVNDIGYIAIDSWSGDAAEQFDDVLEQMRNTRGLIVDVRLNGGGSEPMAMKVAGRFADKTYVYAYHQIRNGPKHTDLTEKHPRTVGPRGPWRYDRPVLLLIGQACMSSNESFVCMMAGCPQVTTMGDHTRGSSGNPEFIDLAGDIKISLPRWIDLLPNGTPLDERGVQPDIPFPTKLESFRGKRDGLLRAALDRLAAAPLPAAPVAGPSINANKPQVVSVDPPDGAEAVEPTTPIRIRFDRAMDPWRAYLNWTKGQCIEYQSFDYSEEDCEFTIRVRLAPGCEHRISVNGDFFDVFRDRQGNEAQRFEWSFRTASTETVAPATPPRAVRVSPPSDAPWPLITELCITFDQPMAPDQYEIAGPERCARYANVTYDANEYRFVIPLALPPDWRGTLAASGFRGVNGVAADTISLRYTTGQELFSPSLKKRFAAARTDEKLRSLLENIREARNRIQSLSETVQTVSLYSRQRLMSNHATFKMQGDRQFYGDVSSIMGAPFRIGSDGENCWWYSEPKGKPKLVVAPFDAIDEKNVVICKPFATGRQTLEEITRELNLEYLGTDMRTGQKCHLIRSWDTKVSGNRARCSITTWWIDTETYLPAQLACDYGAGVSFERFIYKKTNETMPDAEFRADVGSTIEPQPPEPLGEDHDRRFLNVGDGSDGRMSVRWGRKGPGRKTSSGLN